MHQLTDLPDKEAELAARGPAHVRLQAAVLGARRAFEAMDAEGIVLATD
jgi:hypothetical protein